MIDAVAARTSDVSAPSARYSSQANSAKMMAAAAKIQVNDPQPLTDDDLRTYQRAAVTTIRRNHHTVPRINQRLRDRA